MSVYFSVSLRVTVPPMAMPIYLPSSFIRKTGSGWLLITDRNTTATQTQQSSFMVSHTYTPGLHFTVYDLYMLDGLVRLTPDESDYPFSLRRLLS